MKNIITKLTSLLIVTALCLSLAACGTKPSGSGSPQIGDPTTFVSIEINPSIELTLDKNGLVATAYGANEDGAILLYGEESNIVGKNYEAAAAYITNLAAELGYIEQGHEIRASVTSNDAKAAEAIQNKLQSKISATAEGLGISVTLSGEAAYSLLRELNALKEKYPSNTAIQNLTPEKYKLVVSASENGEITVTAAAELSNEQLIEKIGKAHKTIEGYATDLYKQAKARAEMTYELAMGIALDGVYNAVYLQRLPAIMTHPEYRNTFYYGAVYQAYMTTARTYDALEKILQFGEKMVNYELDEATVNAIATELGIEDTSVLQDKDGKVTVKSTVRFVENFLDTHELSDAVEDRIEEILDTAEDAAEMAAMASDTYANDLAALKQQIETIVSTIQSTASPLLTFLSAEGKAELETCLADLQGTVEEIAVMMENGLTEEELDALQESAEEKAEAMLVKIKADLSEEELAKAETMKQQAEATIKTLTAEFSARLDAAEATAKEEIERRRTERKNAHGK